MDYSEETNTKASRDYLRLDAMPAELRRDVEATMDWAQRLMAQDKSSDQKGSLDETEKIVR